MRISVSIVEDHTPTREAFSILLNGAPGFRCASSHPTAEDALENLPLFDAGVVLIDIGLPGMDGYEVARRVRAALGASVALVAMTGYGRESDRVAALAAGFDSHLPKPVDFDRLDALLLPPPLPR